MNTDEYPNRIIDHLDDSLAKMDGTTLSRLRQARATAIERGMRARNGFRHWLAAGLAIATVAIVAVLVLNLAPVNAPVDHRPDLAVEDFEILAEQNGADLYEELEFYRWVSSIPG